MALGVHRGQPAEQLLQPRRADGGRQDLSLLPDDHSLPPHHVPTQVQLLLRNIFL